MINHLDNTAILNENHSNLLSLFFLPKGVSPKEVYVPPKKRWSQKVLLGKLPLWDIPKQSKTWFTFGESPWNMPTFRKPFSKDSVIYCPTNDWSLLALLASSNRWESMRPWCKGNKWELMETKQTHKAGRFHGKSHRSIAGWELPPWLRKYPHDGLWIRMHRSPHPPWYVPPVLGDVGH